MTILVRAQELFSAEVLGPQFGDSGSTDVATLLREGGDSFICYIDASPQYFGAFNFLRKQKNLEPRLISL